jgi:hypothetical protein
VKPRRLVLGTALIFAAGVAAFGDRDPNTGLIEPVQRQSSITRASASAKRADAPPAANPGRSESAISASAVRISAAPDGVIALHERQHLIGRDGRQLAGLLFAPHSWTPPPPPPSAPLSPPPPLAPPLPFKYLGKLKDTDKWQVFLARDNVTFIVNENDVIENEYRIQQIAPPSMTLLYLPLNQAQSLTIE